MKDLIMFICGATTATLFMIDRPIEAFAILGIALADIAQAVYDTILRVQVLERKADRKTEPQNDWETEKRDNSLCYKCVKECDRRVLNRYTIECNQYEPKDEPQTGREGE